MKNGIIMWGFAAALAGCGAKGPGTPKSTANALGVASSQGIMAKPVKKATYAKITGNLLAGVEALPLSYTPPIHKKQLIYVRTKGGVLKDSGLGCKTNLKLADSTLTDDEQKVIMGDLEKRASLFNLKFVTTKPSDEEYTTLWFTNSYAATECDTTAENFTPPLAVAHYDVGNAIKNDFVIAFRDHAKSYIELGEAAFYAVLASLGLPGLGDLDSDEKTNLYTLKDLHGVDVGEIDNVIGSVDGTGGPNFSGGTTSYPGMPNIPGHLAGLTGLDRIAALSKLVGDLREEDTADTSMYDSNLRELMADINPGLPLNEKDRILTVLGVVNTAGGNDPNGILDPNAIPDQGGLGDIANDAGFGTLADIIGIIVGLGGLPLTGSNSAALPDVTSTIGIDNLNDMGLVMLSLGGHAQIINGNYTGVVRDALLTMIKIAYAQKIASLEDDTVSDAKDDDSAK